MEQTMDLCTAITNRQLVSFEYDGHQRIVEPAAHGSQVTTGNAVLRGYQVGGTSSSSTPPLWDLFLVDKIRSFKILDQSFSEIPPGYRQDDKHIDICCEL